MIEEAVRSILTGASLASGARIYPGVAPEATPRPFVVYTRIHDGEKNLMDGPSGQRCDTIQISVYADSYTACRGEMELARTALNGYRGALQGVTVQAIWYKQSSHHNYEEDSRIFGEHKDFECYYTIP